MKGRTEEGGYTSSEADKRLQSDGCGQSLVGRGRWAIKWWGQRVSPRPAEEQGWPGAKPADMGR